MRQDDKIETWMTAIKAAAPEIPVYSYLEDHPKDEIDMALVWKHPEGVLNQYSKLKCIASSGAGVDFIFEDRSAPENLPITRVVDPMLASDMSEHVIALIFGYLKNLNQYKIDQLNRVWNPLPYHRITDFTVGILGLGELGKSLAKDLYHLGFKVQGWSQTKKTIEGVLSYSGSEELPLFLKGTQILICLLPLTVETTGFLNSNLFQQMPKGTYVINVARGGHLVDNDLLEQLETGHISGAALDVYHQEPLPLDHPFWTHSKIHMSPHCASVSDTASVVPQIIANYKRVLAGEPLLHQVSRNRGY
ncbi:MAG: glyoxylate/hydroxypyruvate reductase A [Flavobacteriales bacterium]|nr:MAG: glyoxylate/hydroxypyruvate reductase A [Flavobacteriales bacterium]